MTIENDFPGFDAQTIGSQGNAVLGIRDSGKSYTAVGIAERLHDAGIPFMAFDPIGKWRFMRVPGKAQGYPVVVAGGAAGDLPLTVESAPSIVRAAMENGISLVIDLYEMEISKADWRRIVADCVRVLLYENGRHGLRHIFIEEAAEFCPQRPSPEQGKVYAEIEKLARMGGNARLGYTLINQRAEEVSKAVLELCDNLFLHRQKGKNSLLSLTKWLDVGDVKIGKQIVSSLPTLPQGECWAWMAGTDRPVHVQVPAKNSFEPDRRAMRGEVSTNALQTVEIGDFVSTMKAALATSNVNAKGNTRAKPGGHQATRVLSTEPMIDECAIRAEEYQRGFGDGKFIGYGEGYAAALEAAGNAIDALPVLQSPTGAPLPTRAAPPPPAPRPAAAPVRASKAAATGLDSAATKMLRAVVAYNVRGLSWEEAAIVAALVPGNGYFYGGKKRLLEGGFVNERDGRVFLGPNTIPEMPIGGTVHMRRRDLIANWSSKLKQPAGRMLDYLQLQGTRWVSTDELATAISAKAGNGYWYGGVAAMRDANLIETVKGQMRLCPFLCEAQ